jgi:hypothetical protein
LTCGRISAQPTGDAAVEFRAVDVYVDSKEQLLAAYQLEFSVTNAASAAKIVGIEGGDAPAFSEPPFYDPQAMQHERVIIAAFSTNAISDLPHGKTRVATIHLQTNRAVEPEYQLKLEAAADTNGNRISAETIAEERKTK